MIKCSGYLVFHLNLAFSSIPEAKRSEVINNCYWPLLDFALKTKITVGIELTGWTLERIKELSPEWIAKLKEMINNGQCELIGSGYTQMIGPLVPWEVNLWNQKIGLEVYENELGVKPKIILVNEMAFSNGMIDVYSEYGYEAFIMDRDNVKLALGIEGNDPAILPTHGKSVKGNEIQALWADSILFQKFQQFVHGDISEDDYLNYIERRIAQGEKVLPIYSNDAEVFDFRPGRFSIERSAHHEGEWNRIERLIKSLELKHNFSWSSPSQSLKMIMDRPKKVFTIKSASQPVPVKKQAKYNLSRWAVTGRNDTWINTICHRLYLALSIKDSTVVEKKNLCELWASDLRTHITQERWEKALAQIEKFSKGLGVETDFNRAVEKNINLNIENAGFKIKRDKDEILLEVENKQIKAILNLRRGLTIRSLAFKSQSFKPVIGTLPHGFFETISLGADYYSGGVIVEMPTDHCRLTDLERVVPEFYETPTSLVVKGRIQTKLGEIEKHIVFSKDLERLSLRYYFNNWTRHKGSLRLGKLTLIPETFPGELSIRTFNGGNQVEEFVLDKDFDHTSPASTLISCSAGFGATTGYISIGDKDTRFKVSWDPCACSVMPMAINKTGRPGRLTRLAFTIQELDETSKEGGKVGAVFLNLEPEIN
jgi:hypothetical protein